MKTTKMLLIIGLLAFPIVLVGSLVDVLVFKETDFVSYLFICLYEYIFLTAPALFILFNIIDIIKNGKVTNG